MITSIPFSSDFGWKFFLLPPPPQKELPVYCLFYFNVSSCPVIVLIGVIVVLAFVPTWTVLSSFRKTCTGYSHAPRCGLWCPDTTQTPWIRFALRHKWHNPRCMLPTTSELCAQKSYRLKQKLIHRFNNDKLIIKWLQPHNSSPQ